MKNESFAGSEAAEPPFGEEDHGFDDDRYEEDSYFCGNDDADTGVSPLSRHTGTHVAAAKEDSRLRGNDKSGGAKNALLNYKELISVFSKVENVPLDRERLPAFLQRYLELADKVTDAQAGAKLTAILPVMAANIGNRVYMLNNSGKVYCNIWSMIIGPSTVSRKSTVINLARSTLAPYEKALEPLPDSEFMRDTLILSNVTSAKLLHLMSLNSNRLLIHNEVSAFLAEMGKLWNQGMKQKITEIFDGVSTTNLNMERCERIRNPALSMLAASTEGWFFTQLGTRSEQLSGFMQRALYCVISDIDVRDLDFRSRDISRLTEEFAAYDEIYKLFRNLPASFRLKLEQEAEDFRNNHYQSRLEEVYELRNDPVMAYYSRIYDGYWYKFCMLITLFKYWETLRDNYEYGCVPEFFDYIKVNAETAEEAMYMCDYYFRNTMPLLRLMSEQDRLAGERKLVELLAQKFGGRASHSDLMQYAHFDKKSMNSAIDTLLEMEVISVETGKSKSSRPVRVYILEPEILENLVR